MEGPDIAYNDLWMLFKPGDLVFAGSGHTTAILEVVRVTYKAEVQTKFGYQEPMFDVTARFLSHDGKLFGYLEKTMPIPLYTGREQVGKLSAYPLKYHPERDTVRAELVVRGKKFYNLAGIHHRYYSGTAFSVKHERSQRIFFSQDRYVEEGVRIDGRVVVDCIAFAENMSIDFIKLGSIKAEGMALTEDDYVLASHRVGGFSLQEKQWCWFMVDCLHDVPLSQGAFETLLFPADQKRLVRSLARQNTMGQIGFDDIIKNKGRAAFSFFTAHPVSGRRPQSRPLPTTYKAQYTPSSLEIWDLI